jgi:hypothetical protein
VQVARKNIVYVVGAGFSAALGFPLTHDLLVRLWERLEAKFQKQLEKVIKFHHPSFDPKRKTSFPNVEQLLSELLVNEELWTASRRFEGRFKKADLVEIRYELLRQIGGWFNGISDRLFSNDVPTWLSRFEKLAKKQSATIISFNWDLVLDRLLFNDDLDSKSYGFGTSANSGPILLKPHGSLNWFENEHGDRIKKDLKFPLHKSSDEEVFVFRKFRSPKSSVGNKYDPLIVPPAFLKNFRKPVFEELWNKCIEALAIADEVVFIGYSLPEADLHARFVFRCGFHDQEEGLLLFDDSRSRPTGQSKVTIINPDKGAAQRIEAITSVVPDWQPMTAADWVNR